MADQGASLAEVSDLSVDFRVNRRILHAVRKVSWHIAPGETLAILGESGSGKSVMASAFMGLIDSPPGFITGGRILFRGADLLALQPKARREMNGRAIAMIFQDTLAALNPVYPVGRQVSETLLVHGIDAREARARTLELFDRVGIPDPVRRYDDYPHQFSGGQRQRLMIAMAIGLKPDLLIADEPTTALDVTVQAQILKLLGELQAETGMGLLLITHDIGVVSEVAHRVAVMNQGEIVETGTVRQILDAPAHPYTRRLMEAVPGRAPPPPPRAVADSEAPILQVRGLSRFYAVTKGLLRRGTGEVVRAVDDVSFEVRPGETVGIVGESGSGKSTLARTLLGLEAATAGSALYRGTEILGISAAEFLKIRRRMQVVFQDPSASLNPRMSVGRIIAEPWAIHHGVLPSAEQPKRVAELLRQVGLEPAFARRYPHQFSGGQKQRIAIARALALQPELIICDEAVSSLDVSVQAQVIALLKSLQKQFGLSYLFIAHDLPVVRDFADRVLVMWRGKIVEQGPTAAIFDDPQHPYTRQLLASSAAFSLVAHDEATGAPTRPIALSQSQ